MWRALELIALRRIEEAIARGELEGLPGEGKPLRFEDEALIPPEQRMAYRLLKSSGFVPEGVDLRRHIARLEQLLADGDRAERAALLRRLSLLRTRLETRRG